MGALGGKLEGEGGTGLAGWPVETPRPGVAMVIIGLVLLSPVIVETTLVMTTDHC